MMEPSQYILEFPVLQSHSTDDFVVGHCNKVAAGFIHTWPDWPSHALLLVGEEGSGKTHLAKIWQEKTDALELVPEDIDGLNSPVVWKNILIENAQNFKNQEGLFHLYNQVAANKGWLLMTATSTPKNWGIALKDLQSRLNSVPVAHLSGPDEKILAATMAKQFSDRQILVDDAVIEYLLKRMERSFPEVKRIVGHVDTLSLREKARVTIPLARKVLEGR